MTAPSFTGSIFWAALFSLALFSSCSTASLAEFSVENVHSVVHASSPELAQKYGLIIEESWRFLDTEVSCLESLQAVLLLEESGVGRYQASHTPVDLSELTTSDNGIVDLAELEERSESRAVLMGGNTTAKLEILGVAVPFSVVRIIVLPESAPSTSVTHELVHFRLGEAWDTLPSVLEEGLADYLSIREGTARSAARQSLLLSYCIRMLESALPGNDQTVEEVYASNATDRIGELGSMNIYAFGWLLVDSIMAREGVEGMLLLCRRAEKEGLEEIPFLWAMEAAGVPANFFGFEQLVEAAIQKGD